MLIQCNQKLFPFLELKDKKIKSKFEDIDKEFIFLSAYGNVD